MVFPVTCIFSSFLNAFEVHFFSRASFLHPTTDTDTSSMQSYTAHFFLKWKHC